MGQRCGLQRPGSNFAHRELVQCQAISCLRQQKYSKEERQKQDSTEQDSNDVFGNVTVVGKGHEGRRSKWSTEYREKHGFLLGLIRSRRASKRERRPISCKKKPKASFLQCRREAFGRSLCSRVKPKLWHTEGAVCPAIHEPRTS
jgi:hypothetical protein